MCKKTWLVEQRVIIYGVTPSLSIRFVEQASSTLISVTQSLIATDVFICVHLLIADYIALFVYLRCVQLIYLSGLGSVHYTSTWFECITLYVYTRYLA